MAEVATAYVTLLPSAKGFAKGIQGQVGSDLKTAGRRGGEDFGGGMKSGVAGMATKVFAPLAAAFAGLKVRQWFSDAISAGSDFQQALGGTDAVFKEEAAGIRAAAEDAALGLGLSKGAYLELATALGAGLKNKGVEDFAAQTQDLIGIGADLAATFGGSTKDAVDALTSALRGESDPIERYGVALNETAVNAKLAAMGIEKTNGAYTEQEKAAARLALITEQTADAQGQFAREADTYAGSQERLAASWENIKTDVGTALLPVLTDLSKWFLEEGLPAVKEFGGWVRDNLWPALKDGWETIQPGLAQAKEIILGAFGEDSTGSMKSFGDVITDYLIPAIAVITNEWLPLWATQIRMVIEVIRSIRDFVVDAASVLIEEFITVTNFFAGMLDAMSVAPGFGWAKDAADKLRGAAAEADALARKIRGIPTSWGVTVGVRTVYTSVGTPGALSVSTRGGLVAGRATGGPVTAGTPYIVGERRPELFIPQQNGYILPRVPKSTPAPYGGGPAGEARLSAMDAALLRDVADRPSVIAVDGMLVGQAVSRSRSTRRPGA